SGTVTVGSGSLWHNNGGLYVGLQGTGTLTIEDDGVVAADDVFLGRFGSAAGTLNIGSGGAAGILDTPTVQGDAGAATLNFNHNETDYFFTRDGTSAGNAIAITGGIALNHLGTGTTTLTGNNDYTGNTTVRGGTLIIDGGSLDQGTGDMRVGFDDGDNGTLRIENGATVKSELGFVGENAGSTGTVVVDGGSSRWDNDLDLFVGFQGTGTMTVSGGGTVTNAGGFIGTTGNSSGSVTVESDSSWDNDEDLYVGYQGTGTLTVSDGGTVTNAGGVIGTARNSSGSV